MPACGVTMNATSASPRGRPSMWPARVREGVRPRPRAPSAHPDTTGPPGRPDERHHARAPTSCRPPDRGNQRKIDPQGSRALGLDAHCEGALEATIERPQHERMGAGRDIVRVHRRLEAGIEAIERDGRRRHRLDVDPAALGGREEHVAKGQLARRAPARRRAPRRRAARSGDRPATAARRRRCVGPARRGARRSARATCRGRP